MIARNQSLNFIDANRQNIIEMLLEFLRFPSISTDKAHHDDIVHAAKWLGNCLLQAGLTNIQILPTDGNPVVYAEYNQSGSSVPTILVYGHYDVQPPDPLEQWVSPPFFPEVRGDGLYGRGASDMKGQVIASIAAVSAYIKYAKHPINIKFLIEGEEEIGSPYFEKFLINHSSLLACDYVLNPDAGMISEDIPTIVYSLRGLAFFELIINGPKSDLHSGVFGGVIHNPAQVLCDLIAGMHDSDGRITLPGFYNQVRTIDSVELQEMAASPMDDSYYLKKTGAPELWGENGFSPAARVGARPTLDINGMIAGFTGTGSKTVIPASASVKLSMRLVPDQNPDQIHQQLRQYLEQHAPQTVKWELRYLGGGQAYIADRTLPATQALVKAMQTTWNRSPVLKREGGSVSVALDMKKVLGVDSILTGFGLPDDNIHAPNERLHLPTWYKGISTLVHFLYNLSEME